MNVKEATDIVMSSMNVDSNREFVYTIKQISDARNHLSNGGFTSLVKVADEALKTRRDWTKQSKRRQKHLGTDYKKR